MSCDLKGVHWAEAFEQGDRKSELRAMDVGSVQPFRSAEGLDVSVSA